MSRYWRERTAGSNPPRAGQILEQGVKAPHPQGYKPYSAENQHLPPQGPGARSYSDAAGWGRDPSSTKTTAPQHKQVLSSHRMGESVPAVSPTLIPQCVWSPPCAWKAPREGAPTVPTHASLQSHRSPSRAVLESDRSHQHPVPRSCLHHSTGGLRRFPMGTLWTWRGRGERAAAPGAAASLTSHAPRTHRTRGGSATCQHQALLAQCQAHKKKGKHLGGPAPHGSAHLPGKAAQPRTVLQAGGCQESSAAPCKQAEHGHGGCCSSCLVVASQLLAWD